jgi:predicted GH43/DUF377 family glycosyl hydrolase
MKSFAKLVLEQGGKLKPLIIDSTLTNGTALFNPSLLVDGDKIYVNIRHCQYTLYHSELNIHEHPYGPLVYFNPENDITLTTTNYFGELNLDFSIKYIHKVDTSKLDIPPVWEFVGLEDGRIVKYDDKIYLCGVRRDTKPNGEGRMELSELEINSDGVKEVSRWRIPAPGADNTYCEKNWMPILDMPKHFVKWLNPVEIVKIDQDNKTCETVHLGNTTNFNNDLRGNGQVVSFDDGYLTLTHEVDLYRSEADKKDATYRHRLCHWSKDWKLIKKSPAFSFMGAKIEFACGMAEYHDKILMTFGFQDNAAYILECSKQTVRDFMYA